MITFTRCQAVSGIAAFVFGSFVTAVGIAATTTPSAISDSSQVLAAGDLTVIDKEVVGDSELIVRGPGKLPIKERPPVLEQPPRVPPIKELPLRANEGLGNGVDGDTPGHDNNGGNDDPAFTPGNPGARN